MEDKIHLEHCLYESVKAMEKALPPLNKDPIFRNVSTKITFNPHYSDHIIYNRDTTTYSILCDNVIFGGSPKDYVNKRDPYTGNYSIRKENKEYYTSFRSKGEIVRDYILMQILPDYKEFHYIIFIDDGKTKAMDFYTAFDSRKKGNKVKVFYFPMEGDLKGKCKNKFVYNKCIDSYKIRKQIRSGKISKLD
jgi:hypothetical protein